MGAPESVEGSVDWIDDPYWRNRRLSPAQLLIHDIRIEPWRPGNAQTNAGPWLEISDPVLASTFVPNADTRDQLASSIDVEHLTRNRQEQIRIRNLARDFGWMNSLRGKGVQKSVDDPPDMRKCRWIHISSKFTEYLHGCLIALSDWTDAAATPEIISSLRHLDKCIYQNERFSKHGRYFSPFFESLADPQIGGPMLMSVPFLDWTVDGEPPPLRFHIDPRDGYQSSRSTSHLLRTILQHFYRLEDTSDREKNQVFCKHRPWLTDRDLDLKVRRWFGHYPSGLNVDELWILVIDPTHIVTFSSNQSWKSRWPPLQLASRIAEISFRGIRNSAFLSDNDTEYTAHTHAIACLSGAMGLLHRSFWTDLPLCLADRFAGYLSHLQYRLLRAPSTKLVMDLLQVQEELNIIIKIMQQQIDLIEQVQIEWETDGINLVSRSQSRASSVPKRRLSASRIAHYAARPTLRQYSASTLADPMQQLLENLQREHVDLAELRENTNNLVNRTIQLVNIKLEDHSKAVLVLTVTAVVFMPLSFVSSYFGMNFQDIRNMTHNQGLFWTISCSLTAGVVGFTLFIAFYGGDMVEAFFTWKAHRMVRRQQTLQTGLSRSNTNRPPNQRNFEVIGFG